MLMKAVYQIDST